MSGDVAAVLRVLGPDLSVLEWSFLLGVAPETIQALLALEYPYEEAIR